MMGWGKSEMVRGVRWKREEEWRQHGFDKGYEERNPSSLSESGDKEERSWYNRGNGMAWIQRFDFRGRISWGRIGGKRPRRRNIKKIEWREFEDWQKWGINEGYVNCNSNSLKDSENRMERSWYGRGAYKDWLKNFGFENKRRRLNWLREGLPWQTEEEWQAYGFDKQYNERNSESLRLSENQLEKSWYNRGQNQKWLKYFSFRRIQENDREQIESLLESYVNGK